MLMELIHCLCSNFPQCIQCECSVAGSDSQTCDLERRVCACADRTGKCSCKVKLKNFSVGQLHFSLCNHSVTLPAWHQAAVMCLASQHFHFKFLSQNNKNFKDYSEDGVCEILFNHLMDLSLSIKWIN